ncbi:MAG: hypothetical protein II220_07135 [Spirochaetales bacterium]|nr:hypothetical protein [Spirochaetales bacterium]
MDCPLNFLLFFQMTIHSRFQYTQDQTFFSSGESDPQKIKDANLRYETLCATLENKYARWEELAAMEE